MAPGSSDEFERVCRVGNRPRRHDDGAGGDHIRALQSIDGRTSPREGGDTARRDWRVGGTGCTVAINPRRARGTRTDHDRLAGGGRFGERRGVDPPIGH